MSLHDLTEYELKLHARYRTAACRGSTGARARPPEKARVAACVMVWRKPPAWARAYLAADTVTRRAMTLDLDAAALRTGAP